MSIEKDITSLLESTGATLVRLIGGPRHGQTIGVRGDILQVSDHAQPISPGARPVPISPGLAVRHGTYKRKREQNSVFAWMGWDDAPIAGQCVAIADIVVPDYRHEKRGWISHSCTGNVAKRWQAAWDGACLALGGDPADYRR